MRLCIVWADLKLHLSAVRASTIPCTVQCHVWCIYTVLYVNRIDSGHNSRALKSCEILAQRWWCENEVGPASA